MYAWIDFLPDAFGVADALGLARQVPRTDAARIYVDTETGARKRIPHGPDALDRAARVDGAQSFDVETSDSQNLFSFNLYYSCPAAQLTLDLPEPARSGLVASAAELPAFTFAALGDFDDLLWQDEIQVANYEFYRRPLPDLPVSVDTFGHRVLDVSTNPGRSFPTYAMRLWAAQEMWFGPAADPIVGLHRVRSLPVGEVDDLPGGGLRVRLYGPGEPVERIRATQQAVREWLRFDTLEAQRQWIRATYPEVDDLDP